MPYIKIYLHVVFSTKNRHPYLNTPELRLKVWKHIFENAKNKGIYIDTINGHAEHCHILLSLGTEQSLSKIMHLIKGESSFWINESCFLLEKFE